MVLTVLYFYGLRRLIQETVVDDDLHLMCSGRQSGDIQLNFSISDRPAGILKYPIHEDRSKPLENTHLKAAAF